MYSLKVEPSAYFQALSDPIRIRIMRLLTDSGVEACLCDLSESLLEPDYKLSRHVKVLRQSGLLAAEKEGRWVYHKLVKGVPSLAHLYTAIQLLPDTGKIFASDFRRLKKRNVAREGARCKTDSASPPSKRIQFQ